MDLQELVTRGRFILSAADERLQVFSLINGKRSAREIAKTVKRAETNVLRDLLKMRDVGLVGVRTDSEGKPVKKHGSVIYQKEPLARQIPLAYFKGPIKPPSSIAMRPSPKTTGTTRRPKILRVPTETEILDICRSGEDQIYEFKGAGVDASKLAKEIVAFLNTRQGGIILYGVQDDGTIIGTDLKAQVLDQRVQNAVRHSVKPAAHVQIKGVRVMGSEVVLIIAPPWNRQDVYHCDGRVYIRKGTNVFAITPEESKKLHKGAYVA